MNTTSTTDDSAALEVSKQLREAIKAEVRAADGFLPFRRFMEMALYAPGLGYYVAGARKFGAGGDFVTAPEISPFFSDCLAEQCIEVLERCDGNTLLEFGAGSGVMAVHLLRALERSNRLPEAYLIMEVSPELKDRQRQSLDQFVPHLVDRVKWLDSLEGMSFRGAVVANEVLDAMPVEAFEMDSEGAWQRGIEIDASGELAWSRIPMPVGMSESSSKLREAYGLDWQLPYRSEWNPQLTGWFKALYDAMSAGALMLIDYGYAGAEYYHPERSVGTLIAHFQHRAHSDLLGHIGLQDLTASVDFTAVADAATAVGFDYAGYTTQAFFLMANGLEQHFQREVEGAAELERVRFSQQVRQLTLPGEMGERFQVIGLTKSMPGDLRGFRLQDLSYRL